jgi:ribonuclease BN (tRNA processing enzyme)
VKLHFLGTTGYHPNNLRQTACLMLPEMGVVFDAGTGMFRVRDLIQTETLDIFLTHVHLDHSMGLTFLYDILFEKNLRRVTVHLAEENIEIITRHLYNEKLFPVAPNFEFAVLGDQPWQLETGGQLTAFPVEHPGGCHGFRLQLTESSLAYVTDTTAYEDASYVQQIQNVDTLIHECYFPDGCEEKAALTGHSCLTPVAQVAKSANAGRVFLVHINPLDLSASSLNLDSVKPIFSRIEIANDNQVIEV